MPTGMSLPSFRSATSRDYRGASQANMRMKLSRRGGHSWWNKSFLPVAAPPRSLCAIR